MGPKLQSAMEYLTTYGWAILIIAVVLAALFGLGFFNSANLAPKVAAGSCQVYRPNGPGTTTFINLEGTCNNELPQYVAKFNGASSLNAGSNITGSGVYVNLPISNFEWIYPTNYGSSNFQLITQFAGCNIISGGCQLALSTTGKLEVWNGGAVVTSSLQAPLNTWSFVGYTLTSTTVTYYLNGQSSSSGTGTSISTPATSLWIVGWNAYAGGGIRTFKGSVSNVQVYNTSLSANEVAALYDEGIGGDPLVLNSLIGWWPLNGNANDYSGNLNNGVPTGIVFTSSWTSGYSAP